jgi:hypothetical protein
MSITFTNKETYLAWRTKWRAKYAKLSETIRECKRDRNRSGREFYRRQACGMMEVRKASKVEAQRQYLAAKAERELAASAPTLAAPTPA